MIKRSFANENSWIHLVATNGLQIMLEGCLPIKENDCEGGFAYFSGKDFGHICTTYISNMYFWSMDVYKGAWCVYFGCQFLIQYLKAQACDSQFVWGYWN